MVDISSDEGVMLSGFSEVEDVIGDNSMGGVVTLGEFEGKVSPCIILAGTYVKDPVSGIEEFELVVHFQQA